MKKDKCPNCRERQEVQLIKNVGYDVSEDGEEHQHLEKCKCGSSRFVIDFYGFDAEDSGTYYGKWSKNG